MDSGKEGQPRKSLSQQLKEKYPARNELLSAVHEIDDASRMQQVYGEYKDHLATHPEHRGTDQQGNALSVEAQTQRDMFDALGFYRNQKTPKVGPASPQVQQHHAKWMKFLNSLDNSQPKIT